MGTRDDRANRPTASSGNAAGLPKLDSIGQSMRELGISRPLAQLIESASREHGRLSEQALRASHEMSARELMSVTSRIGRLEVLLRDVANLRTNAACLREFETEMTRGTPEDRRTAVQLADEAREQHAASVAKIRQSFLGSRPEWDRDAIVEIRITEGQDQSEVFAQQLLQALVRTSAVQGLQTRLEHVVETNPRGGGHGVQEAIISVSGGGAFGIMSLEAGVHRLETTGTTSGKPCTGRVAITVHPDSGDEDVQINPGDLEISTLRSGGPGGQHVQKVETGVRVRYIPTGLQVVATTHRSQKDNKKSAMRILEAKLRKLEEDAQADTRDAARRRSGAGTERTAYVRSYDFLRGEVKDARTGQRLRLDTVLRQGLQLFHEELIDQLLGE